MSRAETTLADIGLQLAAISDRLSVLEAQPGMDLATRSIIEAARAEFREVVVNMAGPKTQLETDTAGRVLDSLQFVKSLERKVAELETAQRQTAFELSEMKVEYIDLVALLRAFVNGRADSMDEQFERLSATLVERVNAVQRGTLVGLDNISSEVAKLAAKAA